MLTLSDSTEEWLYDEGRGQTASVYKERLSDIRKLAGKIFKRYERTQFIQSTNYEQW